MEESQVVIRLTGQRENRRIDLTPRLKPGLVIVQETDVHPVDTPRALMLDRFLTRLVEEHKGNVVLALLSLFPNDITRP